MPLRGTAQRRVVCIARQFRSIAAPKGIPKEALKYYEELFKKLSESKTWKEKYIKENMLSPHYLNSTATFKLWGEQNAWFAKTMKEMKLIKSIASPEGKVYFH